MSMVTGSLSPRKRAAAPAKPSRSPAKPSQPSQPSPAALATAWAALGKIASKEGNRDLMPEGSNHTVNLAILGDVDGEMVEIQVGSRLSVGFDSTRASSVTPDADHVVAYLLSRMNPATRARVLSELPEQFAANGNHLPEVDSSLIDAAEGMLTRLRAKVEQNVRGSVAVKYLLAKGE